MLADVTDSTHFFWELAQAGKSNPKALFDTSCIYSKNMEDIFNMMKRPKDGIISYLGNTMGDGFILIGKHGHGANHIRRDAPRVLKLAKYVKQECDQRLSQAKQKISNVLERYGAPRELPEMETKISLHHGYIVTIMKSRRFFGDTVNYCARVASASFKNWNDGIVLTKDFLNIIPFTLRNKVTTKEKVEITIPYPTKKA
ncbi:unnamed protein product, partial [marine sediment metagenome]